MLGYQISCEEGLLNNAGNPYVKAFHSMHSHSEECELIDWYISKVLMASVKDYWGYCTSGSTEGLLCGLWMARNRFPEKTPIYTSEDCHFCVPKMADILKIPLISIKTNHDGSICVPELFEHLSERSHAIVVLTLGTTVRNAYDDVKLFDNFRSKQNTCEIHLHYDAAFGGAIYPFIKSEWLAYPFDSFNVSLHKFFGSPSPCAIFLTTKEVQKRVDTIGYFGNKMLYLPDKDMTISCSRDGQTVKQMRDKLLRSHMIHSNYVNIKKCLSLRYDFTTMLEKETTVQYRVANEELSLSVELLNLPYRAAKALSPFGVSIRNKVDNTFDTHIYVCNHVTTELLKEFADVLKQHTS